MEDPKLVREFRKLFDAARKQGFSEQVIRESAHEASPKAKWHERAYMTIVESASASFGITMVLLVILFSSLVNSSFLLPFLLFLPGGILYYFAISAFQHHAGAKFFMTVLISVLLSVSAIIITNLYRALLASVTENFGPLTDVVGAELLATPLAVSLPSLIAAIFLAYNLPPVIDYIRESFSRRVARKK